MIRGPDAISRRTLASWRKHGFVWRILTLRLPRGVFFVEAKAQFAIGIKVDASKHRLDVWMNIGPIGCYLKCR